MNDKELQEKISELEEINRLQKEIIFNLIHINKNFLSENKKLKEENKEIRTWKYTIDTIEDLDKLKRLDIIKIKGKEYLAKSKIEEKIKEINKRDMTIYIGNRTNGKTFQQALMYELKRALQELLEETNND